MSRIIYDPYTFVNNPWPAADEVCFIRGYAVSVPEFNCLHITNPETGLTVEMWCYSGPPAMQYLDHGIFMLTSYERAPAKKRNPTPFGGLYKFR